ncbi:protein-tyrosine phosphatase-like protein [Tirmania nivea]|nr:protein-tyrosine phosphatase-like protein [Tirmania nivea]
MPSSTRETVCGNVIEYIQDRLYLACYTAQPTSTTAFPPPPVPNPYYGTPAPSRGNGSPTKRSRRSNDLIITPGLTPVYFCIDDNLLYNAFFHDFGPLHIGHLYRFAVMLHDILGDKQNEGKAVVFWSKCDPRSRANAAALLACYMVLIQSWPPHLALAPIAQCDPPLMPFRDAGYSQADYSLTVQDIVYGIYKAKEKNILSIKEFSLEEYERYERVDMGDFNWVTPNFLAFASPQHKLPPTTQPQPPIPKTLAEVASCNISQPFKNVLHHFHTREVGLVVRLNEELYPAQYFTNLGITHLDMYFDDGTCPSLSLVRRFINLAHLAITVHKKNIAVHCKAGLGRTGCLIGAYLVYRYGFTANEVIAYLRFMRPGMVVGPQQHWLHLNQGEFRQWWFEDNFTPQSTNATMASSAGNLGVGGMKLVPSTPSKSKRVISGTPPSNRRVLGEVDGNDNTSHGGYNSALPAPTPGQPRKTSKRFGNSTASGRVPSTTEVYEDATTPAGPPPPYAKAVAPNNTTNSTTAAAAVGKAVVKYESYPPSSSGEEMSEEEYLLRQTIKATRRTSTSRSRSSAPTRSKKAGSRSVSYTMTHTTTTTTVGMSGRAGGVGGDERERISSPSAGKGGSGSGQLAGAKVRSSPRRRVVAGGKEGEVGDHVALEGGRVGVETRQKAGVRKVSGRLVGTGGK